MAFGAMANKRKRKKRGRKKARKTRKRTSRRKKRNVKSKPRRKPIKRRAAKKKTRKRRRRRKNPTGLPWMQLAIIGGTAGSLAVIGNLVSYFREAISVKLEDHPNKVKAATVAVVGFGTGFAIRQFAKKKKWKDFGNLVITGSAAALGFEVIQLIFQRYASERVTEAIEETLSGPNELTESDISRQALYLEALARQQQRLPGGVEVGEGTIIEVDEDTGLMVVLGSDGYRYIIDAQGNIKDTNNPEMMTSVARETGIVTDDTEFGIVTDDQEFGIVTDDQEFGEIMESDYFDDDDDEDNALFDWR